MDYEAALHHRCRACGFILNWAYIVGEICVFLILYNGRLVFGVYFRNIHSRLSPRLVLWLGFRLFEGRLRLGIQRNRRRGSRFRFWVSISRVPDGRNLPIHRGRSLSGRFNSAGRSSRIIRVVKALVVIVAVVDILVHRQLLIVVRIVDGCGKGGVGGARRR